VKWRGEGIDERMVGVSGKAAGDKWENDGGEKEE